MTDTKKQDGSDSLDGLVRRLDGTEFGRFGVNKSVCGTVVFITIYDKDEDAELSFLPSELIELCDHILQPNAPCSA